MCSSSVTTSFLIFLSRAASVARDSAVFTSTSQGLYSSSRITSNPKISKQLLRCGTFSCMLVEICVSTARSVLIIRSAHQYSTTAQRQPPRSLRAN